jgi:signal peptidase I
LQRSWTEFLLQLTLETFAPVFRPRGVVSTAGVAMFVLATLVAIFVPVSAAAGTETMTLRCITTGALLVAGLLLLVSGGRLGRLAIALLVLAICGAVTHAAWLIWLAAVSTAVFGLSSLVDRALRTREAPPRVPDRPEDGEAASDIVESVATAFILALIVREFAFEAFKIPTGSMEPTINGEGYHSRQGDRLLAAKAPLLFAEPKRFSIIVFRYPLFRPTNYIKRLIGLPGEHLENRDGDIYVNGKCVAKPDEVQESLWFPLEPDESGEWRGGIANHFAAEGRWRFDVGGAACDDAGEKPSWITYESGRFGDVRASFDFDPSGLAAAGAVLVRLDGDGRADEGMTRRRVEFEATRDALWLTAPGVARTKLDAPGLGTSKARLGFAVADRVVRVYRDGRMVARVETGDRPNAPGRGNQTSLGVVRGRASFENIRIEHDLQYSDQGAGEWQIPEGCYFMLGDNTGQSRDSRLWRGRTWKTKDGREFVTDESSVRLDDSQPPRQPVVDHGDSIEIYDNYGVHRTIAKSDLVDTNPPALPQPFVKREDLVGRAFFIFWPVPPFGAWRPRILP